MMVGKSLQEAKVIKRGLAYLTPMQHYHIEEFYECVHPYNAAEMIELGYESPHHCLTEMYKNSEAYVCRNQDGDITFVGGLWFGGESPQMFCMFANNLAKNVVLTAKMSKAMLRMFDEVHPVMTMTIFSSFEHMLNWAVWLGFEPCGITEDDRYVEFVRCILIENSVTDKSLRPVVH
jgi:hypothetical protein